MPDEPPIASSLASAPDVRRSRRGRPTIHAHTLDAANAVVQALQASNLSKAFFPAALRIAEQFLDIDNVSEKERDGAEIDILGF